MACGMVSTRFSASFKAGTTMEIDCRRALPSARLRHPRQPDDGRLITESAIDRFNAQYRPPPRRHQSTRRLGDPKHQPTCSGTQAVNQDEQYPRQDRGGGGRTGGHAGDRHEHRLAHPDPAG